MIYWLLLMHCGNLISCFYWRFDLRVGMFSSNLRTNLWNHNSALGFGASWFLNIRGDFLVFIYFNFLFVLELMISDRHQKKEIRQLEQELPRWQVLVDSITGEKTLVLVGRSKHCSCLSLLYKGKQGILYCCSEAFEM